MINLLFIIIFVNINVILMYCLWAFHHATSTAWMFSPHLFTLAFPNFGLICTQPSCLRWKIISTGKVSMTPSTRSGCLVLSESLAVSRKGLCFTYLVFFVFPVDLAEWLSCSEHWIYEWLRGWMTYLCGRLWRLM